MTLELLAVLLAARAVLRAEPEGRALSLLAALPMGVAAASLVAAYGSSAPAATIDQGPDPATVPFLLGVGGLVLLSLVGTLLADRRPLTWVIVAGAAGIALPFARLPGSFRLVGVAAGVLAVAILGWTITRWLRPGRVFPFLDRVILDRAGIGGWQPAPGWQLDATRLVAAGMALVALVVPHLVAVLGGTIGATGAAWLAAFRDGRRPWLLLAAVVLTFLALLWMVRLTGPLGGWIDPLVDGPFSPRAAMLLGALLAAAALILAGHWPLHGASVPVLLAPLAVAVVAGVGGRLVPDGLLWWQPILAPLTLVAMMHAVASRRWNQLLVAAGMYGCWTATLAGAFGGAVLVAAAWLRAIGPATWLGRLAVPAWIHRGGELCLAVAGLFVLRAGLVTEVGYTLLAAVVVAAALGGVATAEHKRPALNLTVAAPG